MRFNRVVKSEFLGVYLRITRKDFVQDIGCLSDIDAEKDNRGCNNVRKEERNNNYGI